MIRYSFRFPADTPPMTYEALAALLAGHCDRGNCLACHIEIGTTVKVRWASRRHDEILVRLYETTIAILGGDGTIQFPNDDPHQASTAWIGRIISDNGLGCRAGRIRRRRSDGPGPASPRGGQAGLLVIDFDRSAPVHGRTWHRAQPEISEDDPAGTYTEDDAGNWHAVPGVSTAVLARIAQEATGS